MTHCFTGTAGEFPRWVKTHVLLVAQSSLVRRSYDCELSVKESICSESGVLRINDHHRYCKQHSDEELPEQLRVGHILEYETATKELQRTQVIFFILFDRVCDSCSVDDFDTIFDQVLI